MLEKTLKNYPFFVIQFSKVSVFVGSMFGIVKLNRILILKSLSTNLSLIICKCAQVYMGIHWCAQVCAGVCVYTWVCNVCVGMCGYGWICAG